MPDKVNRIEIFGDFGIEIFGEFKIEANGEEVHHLDYVKALQQLDGHKITDVYETETGIMIETVES